MIEMKTLTIGEGAQAKTYEIVDAASREANETLDTKKANKTSLDSANNRIDGLYDLTEDVAWDTSVDSTGGYSKSIPSNTHMTEVDMWGGKSLVWNQLSKTQDFQGVYGTESISGNVVNYTVTSLRDVGRVENDKVNVIASHKYFIKKKITSPHYTVTNNKNISSIGGNYIAIEANTPTIVSYIATAAVGDTVFRCYVVTDGSTDPFEIGDVIKFEDIVLIDLTAMFGAGNEPNTTDDDRIRAIEAYAAEHPEYNSGEIVSADVVSIDVVGANGAVGYASASQYTHSDGFYYGSVSAQYLNRETFYSFDADRQYTFTATIKCETVGNVRLAFYYSDGTHDESSRIADTELHTLTLTSDKSKTITDAYIDYSTSVNVWIRDDIALVHTGANVTHPIPSAVISAYPLRSAGSVYDTISFDGSKWWHRKAVGTVEYDGSADENWRVYTGIRFQIGLPTFTAPTSTVVANIVCNRLNTIAKNLSGRDYTIGGSDTNTHDIVMTLSADYATADAVKGWLAENPITVNYELTTPVITDITAIMDGWHGEMPTEPGGTITFVQAEGSIFAIPNTVKHYKNVSVVHDIKVDGESVVTDGVANIDLTDIEDAVEANATAITALNNTKAEKSDLAHTNRVLSALVEAGKGKILRFETDDDDAYAKTVPSGALNATVTEWGGKSVVWNQQAKPLTAVGWYGNKMTTVVSIGKIIGTITEKSTGASLYSDVSVIATHKYLVETDVVLSESTESFRHNICGNFGSMHSVPSGVKTTVKDIITVANVAYNQFYAYPSLSEGMEVGTSVEFDSIRIIDLTQFGASDITSVDDPRIASIEAYALAHPEFNDGTIVNADVNAVNTHGRNLFDWNDFADVDNWSESSHTASDYPTNSSNKGYDLPISYAGTYTLSVDLIGTTGHYMYLCKDNGSATERLKAFSTATQTEGVASYSFTAESGATYYLRMYNGTQADFDAGINAIGYIQLERGSTATAYAPYHAEQHTIPSAVLSAYPLRSAGSVYDTISFDGSKWWHTKRIGEMDMGDLNLAYFAADGDFEQNKASCLPLAKAGYSALCKGYEYKGMVGASAIGDKQMCSGSSGNYVMIKDSAFGSDAAAFNASLVGQKLLYELATPVRTDITDLVSTVGTDLIAMAVESGGTITFAQQGGTIFPVPNTVEYTVKISEVE